MVYHNEDNLPRLGQQGTTPLPASPSPIPTPTPPPNPLPHKSNPEYQTNIKPLRKNGYKGWHQEKQQVYPYKGSIKKEKAKKTITHP